MSVLRTCGEFAWDTVKILGITLAIIALGAVVITITATVVVGIVLGALFFVTSA